jgi:hypothetical protein
MASIKQFRAEEPAALPTLHTVASSGRESIRMGARSARHGFAVYEGSALRRAAGNACRTSRPWSRQLHDALGAAQRTMTVLGL